MLGYGGALLLLGVGVMKTDKDKTRLLEWLRVARAGGAEKEIVPFTEYGYDHDALDFVCNAGYKVVRVPEKSRFEIML